MEPLKTHQGLVYPLNRSNIDTDQIIPKQFLKRIERSGFGQFLFYHWRFDDNGNLRPDFSLNDPKYKGASILVAGENFGCGSSREHAPWAVQDFGFKIVIAPSYADIFKNNCVKNGILPIQVSDEQVQYIIKKAESEEYQLTVDLENQVVYDNEGFKVTFEIAPYPKVMLLNGWDEIGVTLTYEDKIEQYELASK
ncbi:3-isopropylmalate dehydratase small subunit [Bacillus sp. ISL-40]|uniref:3-isopropylmalate dehydratase small subunit n=1 Tax=unclassified Bacillus (in: firmicutes) TaxID=185979 RepID=UPI001BE9FC76|nr:MULTISPECIES: 3-isopropylmalate dehydratase small subunit [unclassified Bacillus (in: firmicutes)]MBT2697380.1 3-isopropylmalate dehydratase small subunit [Bacillus sp. ISL-40]MBT2723880.1 3-isopropylmalate dehydratase small subunit [Bacillus sp. ISL-46]MBT2741802.1 3-isopropylmalate dehydratase small subunit [Bacillus sp. ISL-77]